MKLYLDSADPRQWRLPPGSPPVQGVTTNPALIHQAGRPVTLDTCLALVREAGRQRLPELMLQLPRPNVVEAQDWLRELLPAAALARVGLTIKLPCHPDWEPVIRAVQDCGAPLLLTGLSNPMQLLWARSQGAQYVAPYLGRLRADGRDLWPLVEACVALQPEGLQLLAASIKTVDVFSRLIACGNPRRHPAPRVRRQPGDRPAHRTRHGGLCHRRTGKPRPPAGVAGSGVAGSVRSRQNAPAWSQHATRVFFAMIGNRIDPPTLWFMFGWRIKSGESAGRRGSGPQPAIRAFGT